MKLISFAVISFLAITVSAFPPNHPDTKDADRSQGEQQHQSTSSQDPQQSLTVPTQVLQIDYLQSLKVVLDGLLKDYQETQAEARILQNSSSVITNKISKIESGLDGLDEDEKEDAAKKISRLQYYLTKVKESQRKNQHEMDNIEEQYDEMAMRIAKSSETQQ
ncbi:hypothetical protein BASA62_008599 [Batrachochytrium salamandrivorans]|nr:hypothetical protein BASA62_008599 [Batrachochytrium salamandrivorans]